MSEPLRVLVAGATGNQGGAVARRLLQRGHSVHALTRTSDSPAARELATLGAEVVQGDLEESRELERALADVDAFYVMTTPFEDGLEAEVRQGKSAADAARAAGISHFLYSSVANADRGTGIPHFDSKQQIERHVAGLGLPATIIAPVWFMENVFAPWLPGLNEGRLAIAMPPDRRHQQLAVADLAAFVVVALEHRHAFIGRRIDVASDELAGQEAAAILARAAGRPIEYVQVPVDQVRAVNEDFALMYEWFDRVGYSADVADLRAEYPEVGWHSFADWAQAQDWAPVASTA